MTSFGELAALLEARIVTMPEAIREGVAAGAALIREDARARIGEYQEAAGDLPAWAPLADATKEDRLRKGFTEDDPLLRSGGLRDAIEVRPVFEGAEIGVFDPEMTTIAAAMEFGYFNARAGHAVGPRSFIRAAAFAKGEAASEEIASRVSTILEGS